MGIPDHLTCLLRNLYADQEVTVRIPYGTTDWFKVEKGVRLGCLLSPCLFNFDIEYTMQNAGLMNPNLGSRLSGEISKTSDMQIYNSNARKQRGTKEPLDEDERGE